MYNTYRFSRRLARSQGNYHCQRRRISRGNNHSYIRQLLLYSRTYIRRSAIDAHHHPRRRHAFTTLVFVLDVGLVIFIAYCCFLIPIPRFHVGINSKCKSRVRPMQIAQYSKEAILEVESNLN